MVSWAEREIKRGKSDTEGESVREREMEREREREREREGRESEREREKEREREREREREGEGEREREKDKGWESSDKKGRAWRQKSREWNIWVRSHYPCPSLLKIRSFILIIWNNLTLDIKKSPLHVAVFRVYWGRTCFQKLLNSFWLCVRKIALFGVFSSLQRHTHKLYQYNSSCAK